MPTWNDLDFSWNDADFTWLEEPVSPDQQPYIPLVVDINSGGMRTIHKRLEQEDVYFAFPKEVVHLTLLNGSLSFIEKGTPIRFRGSAGSCDRAFMGDIVGLALNDSENNSKVYVAIRQNTIKKLDWSGLIVDQSLYLIPNKSYYLDQSSHGKITSLMPKKKELTTKSLPDGIQDKFLVQQIIKVGFAVSQTELVVGIERGIKL